MAALTGPRKRKFERIAKLLMPLSAGHEAQKGGLACIDTSTGEVVEGDVSTTLVAIGIFAEHKDNLLGADVVDVDVELDREVFGRWMDNDSGGGEVTTADVGSSCYILDDHSVTMTDTGASKYGRVWRVDATKGVLVEPLFPAS